MEILNAKRANLCTLSFLIVLALRISSGAYEFSNLLGFDAGIIDKSLPQLNNDNLKFSSANRHYPLPLNELQYHGTTTLGFIFHSGVIVAVDSRASIGNYVGSSTVKKVFPLSEHVVATMAGGAADCAFWIRKIGRDIKLFEYEYDSSITVAGIAKVLSSSLRELRGTGIYIINFKLLK